MKDFSNLFNDLSRMCFKDCPTGDELADSLQTLIMQEKLNVVADALTDYYETVEANTVTLPEFCKLPEDKIEAKVKRDINVLLKTEGLDSAYNFAKELFTSNTTPSTDQ